MTMSYSFVLFLLFTDFQTHMIMACCTSSESCLNLLTSACRRGELKLIITYLQFLIFLLNIMYFFNSQKNTQKAYSRKKNLAFSFFFCLNFFFFYKNKINKTYFLKTKLPFRFLSP